MFIQEGRGPRTLSENALRVALAPASAFSFTLIAGLNAMRRRLAIEPRLLRRSPCTLQSKQTKQGVPPNLGVATRSHDTSLEI